MKNSVFLILLILTLNAFSKNKIEIYKCLTINGTITYQEKPCLQRNNFDETTSVFDTNKKKQNINDNIKIDKSNVPKEIFKEEELKTIVSLAKGYRVSFVIKYKWEVTNTVYNNRLIHMKFIDSSSNDQMSLMMDFLHTEGKKFTLLELKNLLYLVGSRYKQVSNKNKNTPINFNVNKGIGVFSTFNNTIDSLNYKYITRGIIYKKDWLIHFTLLNDNQISKNFKLALDSLSSNIFIEKNVSF